MTEARSDFGTGEQAVEWLVEVYRDSDHGTFLRAWSHGDLGEWPEFIEWLDTQDKPPRVGDGTPDAALAIGEHAFKAGWKAATDAVFSPDTSVTQTVGGAWSDYDPPEYIKALS